MPNQFKAGDVVQLKSGGPKMTVTQAGDRLGKPTVWCAWFDGPTKHQDTFPPDSLEMAE